ncbi:MAG: hypothetical protein MUP16_00895 [Sedimentisphaerales bacterium]|nr:hypothetical protein [Sedimentisphaerales bacterium]
METSQKTIDGHDKYKCAMCGEIFEKGWSDKEALNESIQYFGEISTEDMVIVCDDCFNKINPSKFPLATKIAKAALAEKEV